MKAIVFACLPNLCLNGFVLVTESGQLEDLMARDLLQRRSTDPKGQTEWQDSPVAEAASLAGQNEG